MPKFSIFIILISLSSCGASPPTPPAPSYEWQTAEGASTNETPQTGEETAPDENEKLEVQTSPADQTIDRNETLVSEGSELSLTSSCNGSSIFINFNKVSGSTSITANAGTACTALSVALDGLSFPKNLSPEDGEGGATVSGSCVGQSFTLSISSGNSTSSSGTNLKEEYCRDLKNYINGLNL